MITFAGYKLNQASSGIDKIEIGGGIRINTKNNLEVKLKNDLVPENNTGDTVTIWLK